MIPDKLREPSREDEMPTFTVDDNIVRAVFDLHFRYYATGRQARDISYLLEILNNINQFRVFTVK
jgi:hypothetical protein